MARRKQEQPITNQLNFEKKLYTECTRKNVTIAFETIVYNYNQMSFLDFDIKKIFENKINLQEYQIKDEIVRPKFDVIHFTDDYVFLTYSNQTKFDTSYGKMLKNNEPVEDVEKYSFEYIMFMVIDFKTLDIAYIKNKKATFWKESLIRLLEQNGFSDVYLLPYQDSEIVKSIKNKPIKHIEFSTMSKEKISKNISFADCDIEKFVDKCSISLKFNQKETSQEKALSFIETNFLNKKDQYSKILVGIEDGIIDVFKGVLTKSVILNIPKTFEKDSVHMTEIETKLVNSFKEL